MELQINSISWVLVTSVRYFWSFLFVHRLARHLCSSTSLKLYIYKCYYSWIIHELNLINKSHQHACMWDCVVNHSISQSVTKHGVSKTVTSQVLKQASKCCIGQFKSLYVNFFFFFFFFFFLKTYFFGHVVISFSTVGNTP